MLDCYAAVLILMFQLKAGELHKVQKLCESRNHMSQQKKECTAEEDGFKGVCHQLLKTKYSEKKS